MGQCGVEDVQTDGLGPSIMRRRNGCGRRRNIKAIYLGLGGLARARQIFVQTMLVRNDVGGERERNKKMRRFRRRLVARMKTPGRSEGV